MVHFKPKSTSKSESIRRLKRPGAEEEIDDVSLVRLQPVQLDGGDRADVQTINVGRTYQLALPRLVVGNRGTDQGLADLLEHLLLRTLHHRHVGEHVFG